MLKTKGLNNKIKLSFFGLVLSMALLLLAKPSAAATLYLSPADSKVNNGALATLKVYVNTQSKVVNNIESSISFPADLLELISINSQRSFLSLWVEAPNFSNTAGRVSFNGGVPNPGFNGSGEIITMTFRAKKPGTATVSIYGSAVRENDGLGTDILSGQGSAKVQIISNVADEPKETKPGDTVKPPVVEKPEKPLATPGEFNINIQSNQQSNETTWSTQNNPTLSWRLPSGVKAVKTILSESAYAEPSINYNEALIKKSLNSLDDGVWYFAIKYQINGVWSKVSRYRINIDTEAPVNLSAKIKMSDNSQGNLVLSAKDELSGLDHFGIVVDGDEEQSVKAEGAEVIYPLPSLSMGSHLFKVNAYDLAGNKVSTEFTEVIKAQSAPIISLQNENISVGESLTVKGKSDYSYAPVVIIISDEAGKQQKRELITDDQGNFSLVMNNFDKIGIYKIWAYLGGENEGTPVSNKLKLTVTNIIEAPTICATTSPVIVGTSNGMIIILCLLSAMLAASFMYIIMLRRGMRKVVMKKIRRRSK